MDWLPVRFRWRTAALYLLTILRLAYGLGNDDDGPNFVVGEPYINCAADAIYIKFKTNKTFTGHVSTRFTASKTCSQMLVTNNQIEVLVPHEECAVPRRRSLHPSGIILDTSLVVSFHPQFTTSDDRVFHFHCFHQKKKDSKNLEIGTPTKDEKDLSKPTCAYSILRFPGGPPVGLVSLGQTVYHQWKCEQFENSCLHVRNCALVAGTMRYMLIDEQGCSKEPQLLPDLSYLNPNEVGVNVTVFGVVDSSIVHFECELLLQPKQNDVCPTRQCSNQTEQPEESTEASKYRSRREAKEIVEPILEVQSQKIEISEFDEPPELANETTCQMANISEESDSLCINVTVFTVICVAFISLFFTVITLLVVSILQRYRYYNIGQQSP